MAKTVKVKMLQPLSGAKYLGIGDVTEVDPKTAERYCKVGYAEVYKDPMGGLTEDKPEPKPAPAKAKKSTASK